MQGCNFYIAGHPCSYCDTEYSWKPEEGEELSQKEIVQQCIDLREKSGIREVFLTGGEPLSQIGIIDLINALYKEFDLTVQTNGSIPIFPARFKWSMDVKCPSSGNSDYNDLENIKFLKPDDQVKFVIETRQDFEYAKKVVTTGYIMTNVIFQPAYGLLTPRELVHWVLDNKTLNEEVPIRVCIQMHKTIWDPKKRNV